MIVDASSEHRPDTIEVETASAEETMALGRAIGRRLNRHLTLLLYGDLGSGKTAFAQGLAAGLDVPASIPVTSPTYTLINEYPGRQSFHHADLYRLPEPMDPEEIGLNDLFDGTGIVAIEWAQRLHPTDRPAFRLDLFFEVIGDTRRFIRIIAYGLDQADLLKDIGVSSLPSAVV
jgi:tRNA threonylcarbamoyladenosine biosynthesis protein TsaE